MKKFFAIALAAVSLAFVGCQKEQTELDFNKVTETALVSGTVVYSQGVSADSTANYATEVLVPAVGKKVTIQVPLSEYKGGANGNKYFVAVCDSLGKFSLEIPVTSTGINNAKLLLENFTAECTEYLRMEAGKPVFETRMYKFETPTTGGIALPTLIPGLNQIEEGAAIKYMRTIIDMKDYAEVAPLSVTLLLPYETAYHEGAYKKAANVNVEVTILDQVDIDELGAAALEFTYGATTDANGVLKLNLPIKDATKGFQMTKLVVKPSADNAFVHYTELDGTSVKVAGAYVLRGTASDVVLNTTIKVTPGVDCALGERALEFVPGYNNGIASEVKPKAWDANLAGWVFGTSDYQNMTETVKLTGKVMIAAESAYGQVAYGAKVLTVNIMGDDALYNNGGEGFDVLTNANGEFSFEIPVEDALKNPVTTWTVSPVLDGEKFDYYKDAATKVTLPVKDWKTYEIKEATAEWYELGTIYKAPVAYVLSGTPDPNYPFVDYAPLFKVAGATGTAAVTAKVYVAKEKSFGVGEFAAAAGKRAKVTVTDYYGASSSYDFVAMVAADGSVSVELPVLGGVNPKTSEVSEVSLFDDEENEFVHYYADRNVKLPGKYNAYKSVKVENAEWNQKDTQYFTFEPDGYDTSDPDKDKTFVDDLAGWRLNPDATATVKVSGKLQKGVETGYYAGKYENVNNQLVRLSDSQNSWTAVVLATNGVFQYNVPVEFDTDEPTVALDATPLVVVDDKVAPYEHYENVTKKVKMKLDYTQAYKVDGADWSDLGSIYLLPDKTGVERDLADWYIDENVKHTFVQEVSGTLLFGVEKGLRAGAYEPAVKTPVMVSVGGKNLWTLTDNEGNWSVNWKLEFSDETAAAALGTAEIEVEDFVHYRSIKNPEETQELKGKYAHKYNEKPNDAKWYQCGTEYMTFTPETAPANWSSNLLGWYRDASAKTKINVKLYAQQAYEKADGVAAWTSAGSRYATVKLPGMTFDVLVSGKSISLSGVPYPTELSTGDNVKVDVTFPGVGDETISTFKHYDGTKTSNIKGKFQDAHNVNNANAEYNETGNVLEYKVSAKLTFLPESAPSNWSSYDWVSILANEHDVII